ncbi:MAG: hypothetical protein V1779_14880 [bacterium]
MKKFLFLIAFLLMNFYTAYSIDCGDIDCPPGDGWIPDETGWVVIQLNDEVSCIGKICYCYDTTNIPLTELAHFYVRKIIWLDTTCYPNNYGDIVLDIFKASLITEMLRDHMDIFPFVECPNQSWANRIYTSWCYASAFITDEGTINRYPVSLFCLGDGYCFQGYKYCWDTSQTPWILTVVAVNDPTPYQLEDDCILPFVPGPNIDLIHGCMSFCE